MHIDKKNKVLYSKMCSLIYFMFWLLYLHTLHIIIFFTSLIS